MEASEPTVIYCDNLNNIQLMRNLIFHAPTKYIEVYYYFLHECVLSGEAELLMFQWIGMLLISLPNLSA